MLGGSVDILSHDRKMENKPFFFYKVNVCVCVFTHLCPLARDITAVYLKSAILSPAVLPFMPLEEENGNARLFDLCLETRLVGSTHAA